MRVRRNHHLPVGTRIGRERVLAALPGDTYVVGGRNARPHKVPGWLLDRMRATVRTNPRIDSLEAAQKRYQQMAAFADPKNNASPNERAFAEREMARLRELWPGCDAKKGRDPFDDLIERMRRRAEEARAAEEARRQAAESAPEPRFRVGNAVWLLEGVFGRTEVLYRVASVARVNAYDPAVGWTYGVKLATGTEYTRNESQLRPATREEVDAAKAAVATHKASAKFDVGSYVYVLGKGGAPYTVTQRHWQVSDSSWMYKVHGLMQWFYEKDLSPAPDPTKAPPPPPRVVWAFEVGDWVHFRLGKPLTWVITAKVTHNDKPAYHLRMLGDATETQNFVSEGLLRLGQAQDIRGTYKLGDKVAFRDGKGPGGIWRVVAREQDVNGFVVYEVEPWDYSGARISRIPETHLRKARPGEASLPKPKFNLGDKVFLVVGGGPYEVRDRKHVPTGWLYLVGGMWIAESSLTFTRPTKIPPAKYVVGNYVYTPSGARHKIHAVKWEAVSEEWFYDIGIGWAAERDLKPAPAPDAAPPPPPKASAPPPRASAPPPGPTSGPGWTKRAGKFYIDGTDKWFGTQAKAEAYVAKMRR